MVTMFVTPPFSRVPEGERALGRHGRTVGRHRRLPNRAHVAARRVPLALALLIVLQLALGAHGAGAFRGWCRTDPQFLIGGRLALVGVAVQVPSMQVARVLSAGEPIKLVLTVPADVDAQHLASGNGFGYGYDVTIEHSSELRSTRQIVPVMVAVYVPMTEPNVAVEVSFAPAGWEGSAAAARDEPHHPEADAGKPRGRAVLVPGTAYGTSNAWVSVVTPP